MIRYIIHLNVEYYEPEDKSAKEIASGKNKNEQNAVKEFLQAINTLIKDKKVKIVKEEYKGPMFPTAVFLDLDEERLEEVLNDLRALKIVATIEPNWEPWPKDKAPKIKKDKDISRFLK